MPVLSDYFLTDPYAICMSAVIVLGVVLAFLVVSAVIGFPFHSTMNEDEERKQEIQNYLTYLNGERLDYLWKAKAAGHGTPEAKYWHDRAREIDAEEKEFLKGVR